MGELATLYVNALREARPSGPYLLGGWSSGGVIAFEMARQLLAAGEHVPHVIVIDTPAPVDHEPIDDAAMVLWFLEDLGIGFAPASVDEPARDRLRAAGSWQDRLTLALSLVPRRANATNPASDQLGPVFDVFRGVLLACRGYRPALIGADIHLLQASEGTVGEFANHPAGGTPDWGWSGLTSGRVTCTTVPGSHHTILTPDHVDALVSELRRLIG